MNMPNLKRITDVSNEQRHPVAIKAEYTYMLKEIATLRPDLYNASEIAHEGIKTLWAKIKAEANLPLVVNDQTEISSLNLNKKIPSACLGQVTSIRLALFRQSLLTSYNNTMAQAGLVPTRVKVAEPANDWITASVSHGGPIALEVRQ